MKQHIDNIVMCCCLLAASCVASYTLGKEHGEEAATKQPCQERKGYKLARQTNISCTYIKAYAKHKTSFPRS